MSDNLIQELNLPKPFKNLEVNKCFSLQMMGKIMEKLEHLCEEIKPSHMLVYGDTTSTLAAALTAVKLEIPLAHVEAGPRMGNIRVPEEYNRILVDRSSDVLFCPDKTSALNLQKEGVGSDKIFFVGDVMYDLFLKTREKIVNKDQDKTKDNYVLLTLHRQHNVDDPKALMQLLDILHNSNYSYIAYPSTNKTKVNRIWFGHKKLNRDKIKTLPPLPYLETMELLLQAQVVVTDSGGLQKEAYFAGKPCYVFLDATPWPEIETVGWQKVMGYGNGLIEHKIDFEKDFAAVMDQRHMPKIFGDGTSAKQMSQIIKGW